MTRSRTQSRKVVVGIDPVQYLHCAMNMDMPLWFRGFRWMIPVLGLRGLAKRKDQRSTTYALRKWIPKFWSLVGQGRKRLIARVEQRLWETSLTSRIFQRKGGCWKVIHNKVNFKIDARPERDPVELTDYLYDAGVPGGPVNNVFKIILTIFSFFMWVSCTP